MSQPRSIKDFFKRPAFVQNNKFPSSANIPALSQPSSSPLSDPPSDLPSQFASSQQLPDPIDESQTNSTLIDAAGTVSFKDLGPVKNDNAVFCRSSSHGGSFNSSQRIVKNGQEIVIDSDADSTSSIDSFESASELLNKFLASSSTATSKRDAEIDVSKPTASSRLRNRRTQNPPNFRAISDSQGRKYKFSLESLVTRAVDDGEIEASVAKAKALLGGHDETTAASANESRSKEGGANLQEDVLVAALSSENQDNDFERLLNAVKRTEAFEEERSWSFFQENLTDESDLKTPEFPKNSINPKSREAFLRESFTRDRAFLSGILDFALSRERLPDEVLIWMFRSVPLEPRDELRYAYCRALKHANGQRIESLFEPQHIDEAFINLGSDPVAIATHDAIVPKMSDNHVKMPRNWKFLLSVIELLRDIAEHLLPATRERTLYLLFRLALDTTVSNNDLVVAALEATIDSFLQSIPLEEFEQITRSLGEAMFMEVKDVTFQSQLLRHVLPTSPRIASFRSRLAMAYLSDDVSLLEDSSEEVLLLSQIINHLRATRLDTQLYKARLANDYSYTDLKAITCLLNIVIDAGRTNMKFSDKETERQFNADVDTLAEQVKRIFSAMEDSGAAHLKRTEAKQSLEALHYRIIYSIRSRPRTKSVFGHANSVNRIDNGKWFKKISEETAQTPIA